jgi:hypothetical protein
MGADVLLEIADHLFSMIEVLDDEEDGHGEGEEGHQACDDLKTERLVELDLLQFSKPHPPPPRTLFQYEKNQ